MILAFSDRLKCDPSVRRGELQVTFHGSSCCDATPNRGWNAGFGSLLASFAALSSPDICGLPHRHGGLPVARLRLLPG
ncbi:MAG: hypothetical protein V4719_29625 [Planctomycetota bacterium]